MTRGGQGGEVFIQHESPQFKAGDDFFTQDYLQNIGLNQLTCNNGRCSLSL